MSRLKHIFNKYFVFKGYVVIHHNSYSDDIIAFEGYRDLRIVYKHYVPRGSDVSVYVDVCSELGSAVLFYLVLIILITILVSV